MLIIVDARVPAQAKEMLLEYGSLLELESENITYPAISGHPDIFLFQCSEKLIIAPNLSGKYKKQIESAGIHVMPGELPVGSKYPLTSRYNAVVTDKYLIHNLTHTDQAIRKTCEDRLAIHVDQGYCRCNLLPLKEDHFITSDAGTYQKLTQHGLDVLHVSPEGILLESFPHGFFGGCCGILGDKIFILGNLEYYKDGKKVKNYLENLGYQVIHLVNGPLSDYGSIFFFKNI